MDLMNRKLQMCLPSGHKVHSKISIYMFSGFDSKENKKMTSTSIFLVKGIKVMFISKVNRMFSSSSSFSFNTHEFKFFILFLLKIHKIYIIPIGVHPFCYLQYDSYK